MASEGPNATVISNEEPEEDRPRDINIVRFVKDRVSQIAELLEVVDNPSLVAGEVTKGPRTALQRLPRHMRRRAMSYNVKRLPRAKRRFSASVIAASKHRKKPPSRFWRRRPRNLLLNYIRRQKRLIWLETHVWHAKRFHMEEKWGYKLPQHSFQRAFRPTYRDSVRHCAVRDVSFLRCFQICSDNKTALIESLRPLCAPSASATFMCSYAAEGKFEVPVLLFEPGLYPRGFIGPARFMWVTPQDCCCCLIIWCHPSFSESVLRIFIRLLNLMKHEDLVESSNSETARNIDHWRLRSLQLKTDVYTGPNNLKLIDLRDQLVRFRMHGPKSFAVLTEVLSPVKIKDFSEPWMSSFSLNNSKWNSELCSRTSGELPDGSVITLLVEDPRLSRPLRKRRPLEVLWNRKQQLNRNDIPPPRADFWDIDKRIKAMKDKMSESDVQRRRCDNMTPIRTSKAKIPVVLVVRNSGTGSSNIFTGSDLIVPCGFGMEFWIALQYGTARAAGLRDQKAMEFEANRLNFPADVPDCTAGTVDIVAERDQLQKRYLSRPRNRRINYQDKLGVRYPFSFEWEELVKDWQCFALSRERNESDEGFYVLRDRQSLLAVDSWLRGKASEPKEILNANSAALVPVYIEATSTGRPLRFALICVPNTEDTELMKRKSDGEKGVRIEEVTAALKDTEKEKEDKMEQLEEFVELNGVKKEIQVSLNSLFPDKELLRGRKMVAKRKQKREKSKVAKRRRKMNQSQEDRGESSSESDLIRQTSSRSLKSYRDYSSRLTIGRIVRGDYSLVSGKGRALGYCSLLALKSVGTRKVLFRNVTSTHYHVATISVLRTNPDL